MRKLFISLFLIFALAVLAISQTTKGTFIAKGQGVVRRAAAGGATNFVEDTFTDGGAPLPLVSHTGEIGAAWTDHPNYLGEGGQFSVNASGRVRATEGVIMAYASGTPPSADYTVIAEGVYQGDPGQQRMSIVGRASTTTGDWYAVEYFFAAGAVTLVENTAGTFADLGSPAAVTLVTSDTIDLKLVMTGTTIAGYYQKNGGGYILIDSVTDATISTAGKVGFNARNFAGANLGIEFTRITAQ